MTNFNDYVQNKSWEKKKINWGWSENERPMCGGDWASDKQLAVRQDLSIISVWSDYMGVEGSKWGGNEINNKSISNRWDESKFIDFNPSTCFKGRRARLENYDYSTSTLSLKMGKQTTHRFNLIFFKLSRSSGSKKAARKADGSVWLIQMDSPAEIVHRTDRIDGIDTARGGQEMRKNEGETWVVSDWLKE